MTLVTQAIGSRVAVFPESVAANVAENIAAESTDASASTASGSTAPAMMSCRTLKFSIKWLWHTGYQDVNKEAATRVQH